MRIAFVFFCLVFSKTLLFGQCDSSSVKWSFPSPQGYNLDDVYFPSSSRGYAVGDYGAVVKTVNAGTTWSNLKSTTYNNLNGVHFIDDNLGFAVGDKGTILRTTDGGSSWETIAGIDARYYLNKVKFFNSNFGIIIGKDITGPGYGLILKTTDGGLTWSSKMSNTNRELHSISFGDANTLYTGGYLGTFLKSTDAGENWLPISITPLSTIGSVFNTAVNTIFIVDNAGNIRKSTNGGTSWTYSHSGNGSDYYKSVFFINANVGYAIGGGDYAQGRLLVTTNGGSSWTLKTISANRVFTAIHCTSSTTAHVVGYDGEIIKTTNSGSSFVSAGEFFFPGNIIFNSAYFTSSKKGYVAGRYLLNQSSSIIKGLLLTTDDGGVSWSLSSASSLSTNAFTKVFFIDSDYGWIADDEGRILKTTDGGVNWSFPGLYSNYINNFVFCSQTIGYIVGQNGRITKTFDGGANWTSQISNTSANLYGVAFSNSLLGYAVGAGGKIIKTADGGLTWISQVSGTTEDLIAIASHGADTAFAVGTNGKILKTVNGGANWISLSSSETSTLRDVKITDYNVVYITGASLLKSTDAGISWNMIGDRGYGFSEICFPEKNVGYGVASAYNEAHLFKFFSYSNNDFPSPATSLQLRKCYNSTFKVSLSGELPSETYSWYKESSGGTSLQAGPVFNMFNLAGDTTIYVTKKNLAGCESLSRTAIQIDSIPLPTINAGTDQDLCSGTLITLTGSGAVSYSWDNSVINGSPFSATSTKTYTVLGTDVNGCSNTDQVLVNVKPLPPVDAGNNQSVCIGTSATLNGNGAISYAWDNSVTDGIIFTPTETKVYTVTGLGTNGCTNTDQVTVTVNNLPLVIAGNNQSICVGASTTINGSGAVSYAWDNSVIDGITFTPTETKVYTVTGTDANNCSNTDQLTITVNDLPTVQAGADQSICIGTNVVLTGSGAVSYSWDNTVLDGVSFIPLSTNTYTVTGTDANNCSNTDQLTITVIVPPVNAGPDQSICQGASAILNGSGAVSFSWDNAVVDGVSFIPSSTNVYTVTGTDVNNCSNTDQVTITVIVPPVNAGPDQSICQGASAILNGSGAVSFSWDNAVVDGVSFIPSSTNVYTVTGTDVNNCSNTDQLTIVVNNLPDIDAGPDQSICQGASAILNGSGAVSFSWDNAVVDGVSFIPSSTNVYTVTGTDVNNCSNTDQVTITIDGCTSIADAFTTERIKIYPNPVLDELIIETTMSNINIEVFNMKGSIVATYKNKNEYPCRLDLTDLSTGLYLVKVTKDNHQLHKTTIAKY